MPVPARRGPASPGQASISGRRGRSAEACQRQVVLARERDQLVGKLLNRRGLAAQLVEQAGMVQGMGEGHAVRQHARPGEPGMGPWPRLSR